MAMLHWMISMTLRPVFAPVTLEICMTPVFAPVTLEICMRPVFADVTLDGLFKSSVSQCYIGRFV